MLYKDLKAGGSRKDAAFIIKITYIVRGKRERRPSLCPPLFMPELIFQEGLAALSDTHPDADEFKSLPSEIQHEILRELKERKKYHSLSHLTKMPEVRLDLD